MMKGERNMKSFENEAEELYLLSRVRQMHLDKGLSMFFSLNPKERTEPRFIVFTERMCKEGRGLFKVVCQNDSGKCWIDVSFPIHYFVENPCNGKCKDAFEEYLIRLAD